MNDNDYRLWNPLFASYPKLPSGDYRVGDLVCGNPKVRNLGPFDSVFLVVEAGNSKDKTWCYVDLRDVHTRANSPAVDQENLLLVWRAPELGTLLEAVEAEERFPSIDHAADARGRS